MNDLNRLFMDNEQMKSNCSTYFSPSPSALSPWLILEVELTSGLNQVKTHFLQILFFYLNVYYDIYSNLHVIYIAT